MSSRFQIIDCGGSTGVGNDRNQVVHISVRGILIIDVDVASLRLDIRDIGQKDALTQLSIHLPPFLITKTDRVGKHDQRQM